MNTQRIPPKKQLMLEEEIFDFIKIIRKMDWLYKLVLQEIEKYIPDAKSLLDVGCGDGYLLELINQKYPSLRLRGTEISPCFNLINAITLRPTMAFYTQDASKLNLHADIIICNNSLHHFYNPKECINRMYYCADKVLIISDMLRPETEENLEKRILKRKKFVKDFDVPFYIKNERISILESYNKQEIEKIFSSLNIPYMIKFFDSDYYERYVCIVKK